jgi:hypothetical protein
MEIRDETEIIGSHVDPGRRMLTAVHADTWVFTDTLRPNGHERSMAAKRADFRKCGAERGGRSINNATAPKMQQCMFARGWALDHIISDSPSRHGTPSEPRSYVACPGPVDGPLIWDCTATGL